MAYFFYPAYPFMLPPFLNLVTIHYHKNGTTVNYQASSQQKMARTKHRRLPRGYQYHATPAKQNSQPMPYQVPVCTRSTWTFKDCTKMPPNDSMHYNLFRSLASAKDLRIDGISFRKKISVRLHQNLCLSNYDIVGPLGSEYDENMFQIWRAFIMNTPDDRLIHSDQELKKRFISEKVN